MSGENTDRFDDGIAEHLGPIAMLGIMLVSTIQHTRRLYREERLG